MPLTPDQRAMFQLLLERGQSYEDIAALLGGSVDEVRDRARSGLRELGGRDPDADVSLTDYLLGQADPIGRADAVRHLQSDSGAHELAGELVMQLRLVAPGADLPEIPSLRVAGHQRRERPSRPSGRRPAGRAPRGRGWRAMPPGRMRAIAGLVAAALVAVVAVVLVAGGNGDGEDGEGGSAGTETTATDTQDLARVEMKATSRGSGDGVALFGAQGNQAVLQVEARGLRPTPKGKRYVVWLYNKRSEAFPVARERVGQNGRLSGQAPIAEAVLPVLGQFRFIDVSIQDAGARTPRHSGQSILRGEVPARVREALAAAGAAATPTAPEGGSTTPEATQ